MGVQKNVGLNNFPQQGNHLNKVVEVCFNYSSDNSITGKIVRDDVQEPSVTIINLEDGRFILASECQYKLLN